MATISTRAPNTLTPLVLSLTFGLAWGGCALETGEDAAAEVDERSFDDSDANERTEGKAGAYGTQGPVKAPAEYFSHDFHTNAHGDFTLTLNSPVYGFTNDPANGDVMDLSANCAFYINQYRQKGGLPASENYWAMSTAQDEKRCLAASVKKAHQSKWQHLLVQWELVAGGTTATFPVGCVRPQNGYNYPIESQAGGSVVRVKRDTTITLAAALNNYFEAMYNLPPNEGHRMAMMRAKKRPITCFVYYENGSSSKLFVNWGRWK